MKNLNFSILLALLGLFACQNDTNTNQNQNENQSEATTTEKRDDFALKPLDTFEIKEFIEIAESDVKNFSEFSNQGIIFREDPMNPGREDGGRTYCVGFGVKVKNPIVQDEKGKTYELTGSMFVSKVELDVPTMDSISVFISKSGHARDKNYETYISLNRQDERTIQVRKTTEGWMLVKVSQTNPEFEEKLFNKTPGDAFNEPECFEDFFDEELPSHLQARLDSLCGLIWQKGYKKVTKYE